MVETLLEKVSGIQLKGGPIRSEDYQKYELRVASSSPDDCCYGADCGDCDCGGYCIPSECV